MIIEGDYSVCSDDDYLKIRHDYMFKPKMSVKDIRKKYGLSSSKKWGRVRDKIIEETGFARTHRGGRKEGSLNNYCRKNGNNYMVRKWIDGKDIYFGTYKTREDALKVAERLAECGWDKSQLSTIRDELGVRYSSRSTAKNYYFNRGRYFVTKTINGENGVYFGSYHSEEIAKTVVEELRKVDWDKSKLPEIRRRLGCESKNVTIPKHYYKIHGKYAISKFVNGKYYYFGTYESEEIAKKIVEMLKEVDWNKSELPRIKMELGL